MPNLPIWNRRDDLVVRDGDRQRNPLMTRITGPMRPVRWPDYRRHSGDEPADDNPPAAIRGRAQARQVAGGHATGHERKLVILPDLLFPPRRLEPGQRPA